MIEVTNELQEFRGMFCSTRYQSHSREMEAQILSRLQHGPVRLGELRRMYPQASKKMLAQHLREMMVLLYAKT